MNILAEFSVVALYSIVLGSGKFHGMFIQVFRKTIETFDVIHEFQQFTHSMFSKMPQNLELMVENIRNTYTDIHKHTSKPILN